MRDLSHLQPEAAIQQSKLPALLGISRSTVKRMLNGMKSVSGDIVKLERYRTEAGWFTNRRMIESFRARLNR